MADSGRTWKDVVQIYEDGKHRRYGLLFAVNGGAFALGKLMATGGPGQSGVVLGGLTVQLLALAMALFTAVMTYDIWKFGERMQTLDGTLFGPAGQWVLILIGALFAGAWLLAGFAPPPGAG